MTTLSFVSVVRGKSSGGTVEDAATGFATSPRVAVESRVVDGIAPADKSSIVIRFDGAMFESLGAELGGCEDAATPSSAGVPAVKAGGVADDSLCEVLRAIEVSSAKDAMSADVAAEGITASPLRLGGLASPADEAAVRG